MKTSANYSSPPKLSLALGISLIMAMNAAGQDQPEAVGLTYPHVPVPNSELRSLWSDILGQELEIYIKLPPTYYDNPDKTYLAWYFTDGNRGFPMTANILDLYDAVEIMEPELVVIGVGYKIRDMADWGSWRTRDLTPTSVFRVDSSQTRMFSDLTGRQVDVTSGGAASFLDVIENEVIPFCESSYRISPENRGLGGYSYGGLFTLYALFSRPELFSIYYAGSPSLWWDKGTLFNLESEFASKRTDLKATIFMTAGEKEGAQMSGNISKMAELLQSHNYPGLTVSTCLFPGETHQSCYPASLMRALRVLYKRP
jgi:predicted alpha/beta superfamily hydrolase